MKKSVLIVIVLISLLLINLVPVNSQTEDKINSEVYTALENNEQVRVIVEIKEPSLQKGIFLKSNKSDSEIEKEKQEIKEEIKQEVGEENIKHEFEREIAVSVSLEDIEKLKQSSDISRIRMDSPMVAFLQDSVPLVNASLVWPMQISGINITGINETVCILDTGINFLHPDLIGKNKTCIIDCVAKSCIENCAIGDDNGHGTHVAGIVGANRGINGVGIGISLIGVKVMNAGGSGLESDIYNGLSWCIQNSDKYNISVISMSLGFDCVQVPNRCYNHYCDNESLELSLSRYINNATEKNISVTISTGNRGNTQKIGSPSCIKNATSVGASDKADNVASYSNRNSLVDFLAPGTNINSTKNTGGYEIKSGTSMSAPHVAGALAVIRQAFRLMKNRVPTPLEIQNILNSTGKVIHDSGTGLSFSRINVYAAFISLDDISPNVSLIYPQNNYSDYSNHQSFICNSSDNFRLSSITLNIWNSNISYYNYTSQVLGNFSQVSFNVTNLVGGNYEWNCLARDLNNNINYGTSNFSLDILVNFSVSLLSPINNTITKQSQTSFSCFSQITSSSLKNITLNVWNSNDSTSYKISKDITGISNYTNFSYIFSEDGVYQWNCLGYNEISQYVFSENNTLTVDTLNPIISSVNSAINYNSATINWSSNENANYSINYWAEENLGNIISSNNLTTDHLILLTELASSTVYYYNISSCDFAGNCITNGTYNFTTSSAPQVMQASSSGGGGGGAGYLTYVPTKEEISKGYTKELSKQDKIKFTFFDSNAGEHNLILNEIKSNSVNITIKSSPINLLLGIGQSVKLNLTSFNYYDIYIKLDSIENNRAKMTIQTIHEEIPTPKTLEKTIESPTNKSDKENTKKDTPRDFGNLNGEITKIKIVMIGLFICLGGFIAFVIFRIIEVKNETKFNKPLDP